MKTLDLNAYGVKEMNHREMVETDGGLWDYIIGWLVGKAIDNIPEAMGAYAHTIQEGGKTCTDMGFK